MSERHALSHLFAGAIGHAKNPEATARSIDRRVGAALVWLASYLLGIVEARAAKISAKPSAA